MLVTVDQMKEYLSITSSDYDSFLEEQLTLISDVVEAYCGRKFASASYTQTFYNDDYEPSKDMLLFHFPVTSLNSIYEDSEEVDDEAIRLNKPTGYVRRTDGARFFCAKETVVNYTAGFETIPSPVIGVIKSLVEERYNKKISGVNLNFGSDVQRISIPGAIAIDFDYSLSNNERKSAFGTIIGNYANVLDMYRSDRAIIGSSKLEYVEES